MSSSLRAFTHEAGDSEHWLSPAGLLAELDVHPGMAIAEIGAGRAFYTLSVGHRVGPAGRVFAVEWRPGAIDRLRSRLGGTDSLDNVDVVLGRPARTHLQPTSCDLVILADLWHELDDRDAVLEEARRILRPEGRLAILDWHPDGTCPPGPPTEHRIAMREVVCTLEMRSWALLKARAIGLDGYLLLLEQADESVQS